MTRTGYRDRVNETQDLVIVGLALPYGPSVPASMGGRWRFLPGCAAHAIRHDPIRLIEDHEWDSPIIAATGDPGLSFWDAPEGLTLALHPATSWQREVLTRARAHRYIGMSCGFTERTSIGHTSNGVTTVTEVELKEISFLSAHPPAFPQTWVRVMSLAERYQLEEHAGITVLVTKDRAMWFGGVERWFCAGQAYRVPRVVAQILVAGGFTSVPSKGKTQ